MYYIFQVFNDKFDDTSNCLITTDSLKEAIEIVSIARIPLKILTTSETDNYAGEWGKTKYFYIN